MAETSSPSKKASSKKKDIFFGVRKNDISIIEASINLGEDIEARNYHGYTPLTLAAKSGYVESVAFLIEKGADIKTPTRSGNSAIVLATENGHHEVVELLLQKGASANEKNSYDFSLLHSACSRGHVSCVEILLNHGASIDTKFHGESALEIAIRYTHEVCANLLIKRGAKTNSQRIVSAASSYGTSGIIDAFIKKGLKINAKDRNEYTPLFYAVDANNLDVVRFLLENGADPNTSIPSSFIATPLYSAIYHGYIECAGLLLKFGADVQNNSGRNQETPLHIACSKGRADCVELLLKYGANTDSRCRRNMTPLMHAIIFSRSLDCIKILLDAGVLLDTNISPSHIPAVIEALNKNSCLADFFHQLGFPPKNK